eukprot:gnl/TRDRNA2_/TRDRNA2_174096_c1_seq9.p1 gnl/TRDRNA2_/TRDRNA2_174096_c1~~gnl/TRDRNA2_/TRDRNA2_174096_c1_seq9.p1  ORF type:complete len:259 (-),score=68.50 gnl/TRDRNA2_/TRDRNA2_174096_c1_seq9:62-838(-)
MSRLALCFVLLAAATADQLRSNHRAEGFVRSLEFKHRLRVCNAYPYNAALDVYRGKSEKLTSDGAMPYKTCKDFSTPLKAGDKLEFKVGDASAGTFSVSDLPNNDAVLMLVIHRHDTLSTAVSFESHVFANLLNAQIAIIDTYKGRARSAARIMDAKDSKHARSEELRYDSVVAVNPGTYEVLLAGEDGSTKAKDQLVALNRESYVVLRTGVEAQQGPVYPQELVVYPKSVEPKKAGAATTTVMLAPLLIAAAATLGF